MPTLSDLLEAAITNEAGSSPLQVSLDACAHAGLREQLAALVVQLNLSMEAMTPEEAAVVLKETTSSLKTRLADPSQVDEQGCSPVAASRRDLLADLDEVSEAAEDAATESDGNEMSSYDERSVCSDDDVGSIGSSTHGLTSDDDSAAHEDDECGSCDDPLESDSPAGLRYAWRRNHGLLETANIDVLVNAAAAVAPLPPSPTRRAGARPTPPQRERIRRRPPSPRRGARPRMPTHRPSPG